MIPVFVVITEMFFIAIKFYCKDYSLFSHFSEQEASNNSAPSRHSLEKNYSNAIMYMTLHIAAASHMSNGWESSAKCSNLIAGISFSASGI